VLPPLANEFITLIKDTSLAAVIGFDAASSARGS
jgi:ABC-type amino acid transport system permease subunit